MALNLVSLGIEYFPDPTKGRPVFNGSIFVGDPDTDPQIEINQKQITLREEDGTDVPVSQPVTTGPGGVVLLNGSPVQILVDGNYSLKVLNSLGVQVYYIPNFQESFYPDQSSVNVIFEAGNLYTGGVDRTVQAKESDIISVLDFGVVLDNSTLNDSEIQAAVTHCLSVNGGLYWPEGIGVVSGNISNFHNISHKGPGAIKRGSNTWFVEGVTQGSRTIYVQSNTGANTNDGIANDFPLETEQYAIDALQAIGPLSQEAGTLMLVTGHTIQSGIVLESGDYGWITIRSEDTEVICTVAPAGTAYYIQATGCTAPRYDIFLDGDNKVDRCYSITNGSGYCEDGSGGRDIIGRALYANNSTLRAGSTVWNDIGEIYGNNAMMQLGSITIDGSTSNLGAIIASRGTSVEAVNATIDNAAAFAFYAKRAGSAINSHGTTPGASSSSGCKGVAHADRGSTISIPDHFATDVGAGSSDELVTCSRSRVIMNNCQVTAAASHTGTGILVSATGNMSFESGTLTDAGGVGVDVTNASSFSGEGASIIDSGNHGVSLDKGSSGTIGNGTVTGSGGDDLRCLTGSNLSANGATTSSGAGPIIGDTNFTAFNTIESNKGIIWN